MTMGNMDSHVQNPVWREGLQRVINLDNDPPAGREWAFQVPTTPEAIWWRIKAVMAEFNTSAAVANRLPHIQVRTGEPRPFSPQAAAQLGGAYATFGSAGVIAASLFGLVEGAEAVGFSGTMGGPTGFYDVRIQISLGLDIRVPPGHFIASMTAGGDIGDQYRNVRLLVQEMIYVPPVDYISGALSLAADRIIAAVKASGGPCGCPLVVGEAVGSPTE